MKRLSSSDVKRAHEIRNEILGVIALNWKTREVKEAHLRRLRTTLQYSFNIPLSQITIGNYPVLFNSILLVDKELSKNIN